MSDASASASAGRRRRRGNDDNDETTTRTRSPEPAEPPGRERDDDVSDDDSSSGAPSTAAAERSGSDGGSRRRSFFSTRSRSASSRPPRKRADHRPSLLAQCLASTWSCLFGGEDQYFLSRARRPGEAPRKRRARATPALRRGFAAERSPVERAPASHSPPGLLERGRAPPRASGPAPRSRLRSRVRLRVFARDCAWLRVFARAHPAPPHHTDIRRPPGGGEHAAADDALLQRAIRPRVGRPQPVSLLLEEPGAWGRRRDRRPTATDHPHRLTHRPEWARMRDRAGVGSAARRRSRLADDLLGTRAAHARACACPRPPLASRRP